mgnify:CR=1 FL=1
MAPAGAAPAPVGAASGAATPQWAAPREPPALEQAKLLLLAPLGAALEKRGARGNGRERPTNALFGAAF